MFIKINKSTLIFVFLYSIFPKAHLKRVVTIQTPLMTNKRVFKNKDSWQMRTNISTIVEQKNNRKFPKIHNKNWLVK
jgi:hypothetical protein